MDIGELYRSKYRYVCAMLRCFGVPFEDIEDAAQDVFERTLVRFDAARSFSDPKRWLRGVSRRVALEYLHGAKRLVRRRQSAEAVLAIGALSPAPLPSCEQALDNRRRLEATREAMPRLTKPQAEALDLVVFDELPSAKIARANGMNPGTISQHVALGRYRLAATLEERGLRPEHGWPWDNRRSKAWPATTRAMLTRTMKRAKGDSALAARQLNMPRSTYERMLREHGLGG